MCLVLLLLCGATLATFVVGVVYRLLEEVVFDDTLCLQCTYIMTMVSA